MKKSCSMALALSFSVFTASSTFAVDADFSGAILGETTSTGVTLENLSAMDQNCWVQFQWNSNKNILEVYDYECSIGTVISAGQVWMDRNLGASRVATSFDDEEAYGDLYQWGRGTDGHEKRTSSTTSTLSFSDDPGHGDFITTTSSSSYDWRSPQNNDLWQGESGTNNPCPAGFRLPTETELETERASWSSNDSAGAFASPLKLVVAGCRGPRDGAFYSAGSYGGCWSSTIGGSRARYLAFHSGAYMFYDYRASGFSVRCLEDY